MKAIFLLSLLLALSHAERHVRILHRASAPPESGWSLIERADPEDSTQFLISLQQQNLDVLERRFWAISDPTSGVFAQHMTRQEVAELTAPSQTAVKAVLKWIHHTAKNMPEGSLLGVVHEGDAIQVTSSILFAETLFKTEMHLWVNERNNAIVTKQLGGFFIPESLVSHITLVTGITELPPIKEYVEPAERTVGFFDNNQCNTPYNMKNLYNIPLDLVVTQPGSNASIYAEPSAGSPEGFGLGSIEDYQNALGVAKDPITCILGNGVQYYVTNDTDLEANLDTEMLSTIASEADICFYLMDIGNGWMYEFTRQVFKTPHAPIVISMSYGWAEVDSCNNYTAGIDFVGNCTAYHIPNAQVYVNLTNVNFQKLGVVGHTLLAASGDGGTAGTHGSMNGCATMGPIFPGSSPYVLTVGATTLEADQHDPRPAKDAPAICQTENYNTYMCNCSTSTNEQPALANNSAGFDTGGGFSVYHAQPSYQRQAVQAYLNSGVVLPPSQYFNPNNRGFPDVSAIGASFCLLNPGQSCELVGGTSASTPFWGGVITLLNSDRIAAGKAPLGFVNQVIYQMFYANPTLYYNNDFEYGNNPGGCPTDMGYNSKAGQWTPLTGCGTPNFAAIREYVSLLP